MQNHSLWLQYYGNHNLWGKISHFTRKKGLITSHKNHLYHPHYTMQYSFEIKIDLKNNWEFYIYPLCGSTGVQLGKCFYFSSTGVADGVGGWRQYGIDSSVFSTSLMKSCEAFVRQGGLNPPPSPVNIIKAGYQELTEQKAPCFGKQIKVFLCLSFVFCFKIVTIP